MATSDEILAAVERIETALSQYQAGVDNPEARDVILKEISYIEARLRFIGEKGPSLRRYVEVLYSAGKWRSYGGSNQVRLYALQDCASISAMAHQMARKEEVL